MHRSLPQLRRRLAGEHGFTISEMLVTLMVLGILFAMFASIVSSAVRHASEAEDSSVQQTEVRTAIERFERELRGAYSGITGTYPVSAFSGTSITFQSPDNVTPFHLREIGYQLAGGKLQRRARITSDTDGAPWVWGAWSSWHDLVSNVRNAAIFTAVDKNGNATTTATAVKRVTITLQVSTTVNSSRKFTFLTNVTLRNDL
ncbi:MAG: type II secretion system protein J [Gaiella sp.]